MGEHVERVKQRWPLLDYLQRQNWIAQRAGYDSEFIELCRTEADFFRVEV
jgi:hypothetical protein